MNSQSTKINIMRKRSKELDFIKDFGIQFLRELLNILKLKEISSHFQLRARLFKSDFIPGANLSKKIQSQLTEARKTFSLNEKIKYTCGGKASFVLTYTLDFSLFNWD